MRMDRLRAYIEHFNESYNPPYRLVEWGPYIVDNETRIGVELQLLFDNDIQTLFIVSDKDEESVINTFSKIDFNQYLKQWKEN